MSFESRFKSKCSSCRDIIEEGDEIEIVEGKPAHVECCDGITEFPISGKRVKRVPFSGKLSPSFGDSGYKICPKCNLEKSPGGHQCWA